MGGQGDPLCRGGVVGDRPRNLEAARLANGLGPKDNEAMRRLSEQSGAFHPYLSTWVDGDESGFNGFKTYAGGI